MNIWTPSVGAESKLPVMVWIYGGGFANGMASSPTYDGAVLATKDVIVVTINYRLGVLGFLAHPDLSAEGEHHSSGNFGLEDQIAALRWVSKNVAAFGGDPDNVTLFGQSAGGASVHDLMVSPLARGLFRRAIIQSGVTPGGMVTRTLPEAEKRGLAFADGLSISDLRKMDAAAVLERARDLSNARFGPVVDGYVIPNDPTAAVADHRRRPMPLMIGSNSREGLGVSHSDRLEADIRAAFGASADVALQHYGIGDGAAASADPLLGTPAQQFSTDSTFRCGNALLARYNASAGAPTWQYQFEHFVPGKEEQGAAHSFEVPYVFGNLLKTGFSAADYGPEDRQLSDLMTSYWTNFAKRGDPNGAGLPIWPQYTAGNGEYLRFSAAFSRDAQVGHDLGGTICPLLPSSAQ